MMLSLPLREQAPPELTSRREFSDSMDDGTTGVLGAEHRLQRSPHLAFQRAADITLSLLLQKSLERG